MRQIAQNKQHHWHFSPMTLPYSFSNASNKQQQPPWKAQNKATPTTLVTVTFRKLSMCCRHFPSRDSNPVFASKREHSTLHWLIQCYFRAVVLGSGKKFTFNFTINKKRERIKDTMSFAGFKKQINKANQVRKGMIKDEALTRLFDRHHNVSPFSPQLLWIWFPSYVTVYEREDRRCQGIYTRGRFCGIRKSKFLLVFSGFVLKFRYRTCLPYPLFAAHAYVRANCLLSSNGSQIPVLLF